MIYGEIVISWSTILLRWSLMYFCQSDQPIYCLWPPWWHQLQPPDALLVGSVNRSLVTDGTDKISDGNRAWSAYACPVLKKAARFWVFERKILASLWNIGKRHKTSIRFYIIRLEDKTWRWRALIAQEIWKHSFLKIGETPLRL